MAKKFKPIAKWHGGEKYIFIGARAEVPGFRLAGEKVFVTLKEFQKLIIEGEEL